MKLAIMAIAIGFVFFVAIEVVKINAPSETNTHYTVNWQDAASLVVNCAQYMHEKDAVFVARHKSAIEHKRNVKVFRTIEKLKYIKY